MPTGVDTSEDPVVEREKLLAARGWEADRERTGVLRELLGRSVQRIFLWAFSQVRSRDRAVDITRNTLLRASRTLGQVPEGRLLDHWIFEHLATETPARLDVRRSELGPEPCQVLGDEPNEYYLEAYPACAELRTAYLTYRTLPSDPLLVKRSGWSIVEPDLERFLLGHFGEENAQASETKDPLLHRIRRLRLRQAFPLLAFLALLLYAGWLRRENATLESELEAARAQAEAAQADEEVEPAAVRDLALTVSPEFLTFTWQAVSLVESYRLVLLTAKMDTLLVKENIRTPRTMVQRQDVPEFTPDGSYVFKVEGLRRGAVIASSGMSAYPAI